MKKKNAWIIFTLMVKNEKQYYMYIFVIKRNTGIKTVKKNNIQDYRWLCLLHLSTLSPRCIAFSLTFCTKCWFHKKQQSRQQSHAPGHAERYRPVPRHVPDPPYNTQVKVYTNAYTSIPKYPTIYMSEHILVYPNTLQYTGQSVY